VGQELKIQPGVEMGKFTSKTLNRTFDSIVFSSGLAAETGTAGTPPGHPDLGHAMAPAGAGGTGGAAGSPEKAKPVVEKAKEMPMHSAPAKGAAPGADLDTITGKVVETMSSGGYTYICVEKDGKKAWAAVPPVEIAVGDQVEILPGTQMGKFTSNTLKRTFNEITFSPGIAPKK